MAGRRRTTSRRSSSRRGRSMSRVTPRKRSASSRVGSLRTRTSARRVYAARTERVTGQITKSLTISGDNLATQVDGLPGCQIDIGPSPATALNHIFVFDDARVSAYFTNYERYFVNDLKFEFIPSYATTSPGNMYFSGEYDPNDLTAHTMSVYGASALSQAELYRDTPISEGCSFGMPNPVMPDGNFRRPALYTSKGEDVRDSMYGMIVAWTSGFVGSGTEKVGDLRISYDLSFINPQYDKINNGLAAVNAVTAVTASAETVSLVVSNLTETVHDGDVVPMDALVPTSIPVVSSVAGGLTRVYSTTTVPYDGPGRFSCILTAVGGDVTLEDSYGSAVPLGTKMYFGVRAHIMSYSATTGSPTVLAFDNQTLSNLTVDRLGRKHVVFNFSDTGDGTLTVTAIQRLNY